MLFTGSLIQAQSIKERVTNIFTLTQSPSISDENKVILIVNELISYGEAFKYNKELVNGNYIVEKHQNVFLLKIFDVNNFDTKKTNYRFKEKILDIITIAKDDPIKKSVDYSNQQFEIKEIEKYLDKNYLQFSGLDAIPSPRYDLVYRQNSLVDKKILNGVVPSGQTHILNRERTRAFLRYNGNPANIYADVTDGVIIPDGNGVDGKVFTVDRMWNRIVYMNKDYSPIMGSDIFKHQGHEGSGLGEYYDPTGIDYGHMYGAYRTIYIADKGNNRIQEMGYYFNYHHYWNPSLFIGNLVSPYDVSYHTGQYPETISSTDNTLWFSQTGNLRNINCASISAKSIIYNFNAFKYRNIAYPVNPGRLDTYIEYNTVNNSPERSMLAYVDEALNAVIFIHLNSNGTLPSSQVPDAFYTLRLPGNEDITSIKFITHLRGSVNPVGVLVTSNDANGNGHLHMFKIKFLPGNYLVPYDLEYLSSTSKTRMVSNYSEDFKYLNNIEVQDNYVDIFTSESWDDQKGMRHSKMGVDVKSFVQDEHYCRNTGMNFKINLTNPVKIRIQTFHKCYNEPFQSYGFYANGLYSSNGEHYLFAGINNLRIKINHPICDNLDSDYSEDVKILMYLLPLDETNNSSLDREFYEIIEGVNDCGTGGGCPFVYVFDGNDYMEDNNILHKSELPENIGYDIVDKYLLRVPPYLDSTDNSILLKVKELNNDHSYFDQIKLVAIDHPVGTKLGVTESNDVVLYYPDVFSSPSYAENDGEDVTEDLGYDTTTSGDGGVGGGDTSETKGEYGDGDGDSGFEKAIDNFYNFFAGIFRTESKKAINNNPRSTSDSVAVILDPQHPTDAIIPVNSKADHTGYVTAYDTKSDYSSATIPFSKRQNRSDVIIPVGVNIYVDTLGIDWNSDYNMTYLATNQIFYSGFNEYELELLEADHTNSGDIASRLLYKDETYGELDNTAEITLKFQGRDTLPPEGWERKYLFIVDGRYENLEDQQRLTGIGDNNLPVVFRLHQNYPNPFNPTTTIKFDLPKDGITNFIVYDILGREVFKSNTFYKAGYNEVRFNGTNLASGVYFYKIEVGEFKDIKRMMLIK